MRVGLWERTSGNGNVYLGGADKENNIRYMLFKDDKAEGVRKLVSKPLDNSEAKLQTIATLIKHEKDDTVYFKGDGYAVFVNTFKTEDNQPGYNLIIGE